MVDEDEDCVEDECDDEGEEDGEDCVFDFEVLVVDVVPPDEDPAVGVPDPGACRFL